MKSPVVPFSLPSTIDPNLARVRDYWEGLKRGDNNMPFWDDFRTSALPDLSERLMLIDAFEKPGRFRFNFLGRQLTDRYGEAIAGRFLDEVELRDPLEYLLSQCGATIESRAPTFYQHGAGTGQKSSAPVSYSRLLLPMWGDGHIGMLLGAFDWH